MITLLLSIFIVALATGTIIEDVRLRRMIKELRSRATKHNNDINSLHHNQGVLDSTVRDLHRITRRHDIHFKRRHPFSRNINVEDEEGKKEDGNA